MPQTREQVVLPDSVRQVADLLRAFARWEPNGHGYQAFAREANAYLKSVLDRVPSDTELDAFIQDVRQ